MTYRFAAFASLTIVVTLVGCQQSVGSRYRWRADKYFTDRNTIELCVAIEHRDVSKVKALLSSDVNVNDCGKDGMTPLLWAFADGSAEIFQLLLDAGADPTVPSKSDFGTRGKIRAGWPVAHLAAIGKDDDKFRAILKSGIDPNFTCEDRGFDKSLMDVVIESFDEWTLDRPSSLQKKYARVKELLELKPNQRILDRAAATAFGYETFDTALMLFQSGANYKTPYGQWGNRIHAIASCQVGAGSHSYDGYLKLVAWLESKGEDVAAARADWERWQADIGFDPDAAALRRKAELRLRAKKEGTTVNFDE
jgi:hypothetical protein